MILGHSIRKCAEEVGVCVKTSFFMRHRILDVINISLKNDTIEGIIEKDTIVSIDTIRNIYIEFI